MTTARTLASAFAALAILAAASLPASAVTLHRNADFAVAETVALKAGDSVAVTAKTANLRSGPSSKSKKIAAMSKGTKLQVTEVTKDGWVKVKGPAGDGYVSAKLVK